MRELDYLMRGMDSGSASGLVIMLVLLSFLYFFPMFQVFFEYYRKKWLKSVLSKVEENGGDTSSIKEKLLAEASSSQPFIMYKLFKFYLISSGLIMFIMGILIMFLDKPDPDVMKGLVFLPLVYAEIIYFLYKSFFKDYGVFRELAASFLFIGFGVTFGLFWPVYEFTFLRSDIIIYIILAAGLFLIKFMNSTVVTYLYIIAIIVLSNPMILSSNVSYNWVLFMTHFIWVFAAAILVIWIPKLESVKQIGLKEVIFGLLFSGMVLTLCVANTAGMSFLALTFAFPALYMFSKKYFKKGEWFVTKPIETLIVLSSGLLALVLSIPEIMDPAARSFHVFTQWNTVFYKLIAFVIIAGLGVSAFLMYSDYSEEKDGKLNLFVLGFGPLMLVSVWLGEYGGSYLMLAYAIAFGIVSILNGTKEKDEIVTILGASLLMTTVTTKLTTLIGNGLNNQIASGLYVIFLSLLMLGLAYWLKSLWTTNEMEKTQVKIDSSDILDAE